MKGNWIKTNSNMRKWKLCQSPVCYIESLFKWEKNWRKTTLQQPRNSTSKSNWWTAVATVAATSIAFSLSSHPLLCIYFMFHSKLEYRMTWQAQLISFFFPLYAIQWIVFTQQIYTNIQIHHKTIFDVN